MERFGKRHHRVLGDVVGARARRRDQAGDRRRIDDMAFVLRDEARRERPYAVDHAPEVDAEDPLPLGDAVFPGGAERRYAGVVAYEVDLAKSALRRSGKG